ncbi:hypothetical protein Tco_1450891, partial [Tanacetum coccineum]
DEDEDLFAELDQAIEDVILQTMIYDNAQIEYILGALSLAKVKESEEKTKKLSRNKDLSMYEGFLTNASLVKYSREDYVIKLVVQRLENKAQDGKRERKEQKKLKQRNIRSIVVLDTPLPFWP